MAWTLKHVEESECTMDDSGMYVVVNRRNDETVRADLMATGSDRPIRSLEGTANAVRKALIRAIVGECAVAGRFISPEHASYIGYELARAEADADYVQD